jgi:predicted lipoprotein with Yx(FWY)xxD motif
MSLPTLRGRAIGAAALVAVALLVAACGSSTSGTGYGGGAAAAGSTTPPAVAKATIGTASGALGTYLTDASGRSLYLWLADGKGASACSGSCAQEWPPVTTKDRPAASGSVMAGALGTIMRADGTAQVTYNGHPLYRFEGDTAAGKTTGQGLDDFGAKWWLVGRSGAAITKSAGASSGGAW